MGIRVGTFNLENLVQRLVPSRDRATGAWLPDQAVGLFEHASDAEGQAVERALQIAISDDQRQMSAQAIRDMNADVLCLQEVDSLRVLRHFHDRYLKRALDVPYEDFAMLQGNDTRGIDVAVLARRGYPIRVKSHAALTYRDLGLFNDDLRRFGGRDDDRIFRRDCLEVQVEVGGRLLDVFVCHLKSMSGDRARTMAIRRAEARAIRALVEAKFGRNHAEANWLIVGDMNDYRDRIVVARGEDGRTEWHFERVASTGLDPFFADHFAHNLVERLPHEERWTHFYADGREFAQLDYIFASPGLARANPKVRPQIVRAGLPWRVPMRPGPDGRPQERYPRVGFDRPKASDHCPVVVELDIPDDGRRVS